MRMQTLTIKLPVGLLQALNESTGPGTRSAFVRCAIERELGRRARRQRARNEKRNANGGKAGAHKA